MTMDIEEGLVTFLNQPNANFAHGWAVASDGICATSVLSAVLLRTESRAICFTASRTFVFGGDDGTGEAKDVATEIWETIVQHWRCKLVFLAMFRPAAGLCASHCQFTIFDMVSANMLDWSPV